MPSASVSASASRKRSAGSRWLPARTRPASVAATASDGPSPSQPPLTIWCDCRSSWRRQHDRAVSRPRQTARRRLNPDRIRLSQRRSSHPQSQTEHFFHSLLICIEKKAQRGRSDKRDLIVLSLPGHCSGKRRSQIVIGLSFLRWTGAILQRTGCEDDGVAGNRKLASPALAPQFELDPATVVNVQRWHPL